MPPHRTTPAKARTRVSNACRRCRKHKTKCSGKFPCKSCSDRQIPCEIGLEEGRVVASANDLHNLRSPRGHENQQHSLHGSVSVTPNNSIPAQPNNEALPIQHDHADLSSARSIDEVPPRPAGAGRTLEESVSVEGSSSWPLKIPNPMVPEQPAYMKDGYGNMRYLGHSSTFSFSRRLLSMVHQQSYCRDPTPSPIGFDAETYNVDVCGMQMSPDDFTGLPSLEVALFYIQALKFKTTPLFYLFDEASFTSQLQHFYEDLSTTVYTNRTWYVHYLLVMAFGKTLTTQSGYGSIVGIELFHRALRLLPDVTILWRDLLTATEIMCCVALFLFSIDHRSAGYIYMGQALRMAQVEGLHTNIQENCVGSEFATRGRRIWWTVYTLDRRFSTSMGLPNSLRDEDITAPFPSAMNTPVGSAGQILHINICQLLGRIIRTVYSADGTLNRTFLMTSQDVLRDIGGLADDLANFSARCLGDVSRVVAHLNLAYHQCIILCTRPFLLHLVKLRLESTDPTAPLTLSTTCKGIVQACVDSAIQIAMTLSQLRQHQLLDSFLPFDLECGFSAGLVLTMTKGIHPKLLPQEDWLNDVLLAYDYMIQKGNVLASIRKSEIQELAQVRWNGQPRRHRFSNISHASGSTSQLSTSFSNLPNLSDPFFDQWGTNDGLSGAQLVSLADALDFSTNVDLLSL